MIHNPPEQGHANQHFNDHINVEHYKHHYDMGLGSQKGLLKPVSNAQGAVFMLSYCGVIVVKTAHFLLPFCNAFA